MKKLSRVLVAVVAVIAAILLVRCSVLGRDSKSGQPPGLVSGALAPCPDKPNCVSSEAGEDADHQIAPLDYADTSPGEAWSELQQVIGELGGEITVVDGEYLAATFTSSLFKFVDDVECRLDASNHRIQLRSASRVGHSDLGVNRKRADAIRRSFDEHVGEYSP
ncbi:MAG: DUF1499 domain-containing protein [Deltaproteobacteria bacterium]|jgi:uncharacterized protein (DUF1499 family)|nr:DUF1499 domain-containing protein [Deltaproteobacteria bacterium]MBW2541098.1 DUF1499 domain-containing protein [Deltaproteobacteria bacterium]